MLDDQSEFTKKESLNFPLLADSDSKLAKACGVQRENSNFANRVTFVVDAKGKVAKIYDKVSPAKHAEEVYQYIKKHLSESKEGA